MAARRDPLIDKRTRDTIKASALIRRLQDFALGKRERAGVFPRDADGKKLPRKLIEMSSQQVTAALGLIRKTLPDLQATQVTSDIHFHRYVVRAPAPAGSVEEWQKEHTPTAPTNGSGEPPTQH